jgi:hypothetical protein
VIPLKVALATESGENGNPLEHLEGILTVVKEIMANEKQSKNII